jgi:CubicO group peptidase (beta-lactamase class C family)
MVFPGESWAAATPASQGVSETGLDEALAYLAVALEDYGGVGTVFIVRNGYVIHAGPESDAEHQIYSATKSFVSTVLGLLIQDGRISLDTPAKELEPVLAEHYPGVTLRHFATMTSGYDSVGGNYEFDAQGRGDSWNPGPPTIRSLNLQARAARNPASQALPCMSTPPPVNDSDAQVSPLRQRSVWP